MKEKIAFTVTRYGAGINGGAELHCRMLAERLTDRYDVEVLTTCVRNYVTGETAWEPGVENVNGVTVRRFAVRPEEWAPEKKWSAKVRIARRARRLLYWCGLLGRVAAVFPVWKWRLEADIHAFKSSIFYSPDMIKYLAEHKGQYKAIFSVTATYAPFLFTALQAGEKMIGIPTLHPERAAFRPALSLAFTKIAWLGFNTMAEQRLACDIFGAKNISGGLLSVGIEDTPASDFALVKEKYSLPDRYVVFVGRIERGKAGKLVKYYTRYCLQHPDAPALVMVGGLVKEVGSHENIKFTGFVSDGDKRSILAHAMMLINPSKYESLSLVVLEALRDGVPVLVNGKCKVLKEHCILSDGAVRAYSSYRTFADNFDIIVNDASARSAVITKGKIYYQNNYTWNIIMPRLHEAIERIGK